jgi:hypothetical protein
MKLPAHHILRQVVGMNGRNHEFIKEIEPDEYQVEDPNNTSPDPSSSAKADELYRMVGEISNTVADIAQRIRRYDPCLTVRGLR